MECCYGIINDFDVKNEDINQQITRRSNSKFTSSRTIASSSIFEFVDVKSFLKYALQKLTTEEINQLQLNEYINNNDDEIEYCSCSVIHPFSKLFPRWFQAAGECSINNNEGNLWNLKFELGIAGKNDVNLEINYCADVTTTYPLYMNAMYNISVPFDSYYYTETEYYHYEITSFVPTYNPIHFEIPSSCSCAQNY